MKNWHLNRLLGFLIAWLLAGCDAPLSSAPTVEVVTLSAELPASNDDLHLLFAETAQLNRAAWNGFHPVSWGAVLHRGDLLQAGEEEARIVCDTLTLATLPTGQTKSVNELCPIASDQTTLLKSGEYSVSDSRGAIAPGIPTVITPRHTSVYTITPQLRWHSVSDTLTYTVRIDDLETSETVWETQTQGTQLVAPTLERGHSYIVVVEATNNDWVVSSAEEDRPKLGFTILDEERAVSIDKLRESVLALGLNSAEMNFTLATLYQAEKLYSDAITYLTDPSLHTIPTPHTRLHLGELYHRTLLESDAFVIYEQAYHLSTQINDPEVIGVTNAHIAAHHFSFWRSQAAYVRAENALAAYTLLGDTATMQVQLTMMARSAEAYADNLLTQQHFADALEWYQQALTHYQQLQDKPQIEKIQLKISELEP